MNALSVDMGGVTYRADVPPVDLHALTVAVHDALTGLGFTPWVHVPANLHAPNLARLTTSRAGHE